MPRYFFNIVVRGRKAIPDPEGDVLAGDKEAREHARIIARDMLDRRHWYKRSLEHWAFEITNGNGRSDLCASQSSTQSSGKLGAAMAGQDRCSMSATFRRTRRRRLNERRILSADPANIVIMRRMSLDDLFDFVLIGAGVLIVCVLIAHSPFTHRPRHPMLFGILSAAFIMAVFLLAHLM